MNNFKNTIFIVLMLLFNAPTWASESLTKIETRQDQSPWVYQLSHIELRTNAQEKLKSGRCQIATLRYHTKKDYWEYCNNKGAWVAWQK